MANPGFLKWATSIRVTMANDPGRQIFKDQIETHGFRFLEDYLENILAGPKQEYADTPAYFLSSVSK